ncbi:hypothetical protein OA863_01370 [Bacteroidota bacterium]|nr:hypothetical protein [Bacteroidota bacterium]MDC3230416.1 hypothetical protein [Bacteroidota bacterium]
MMGSTKTETTTKFEFHALGDTRGVIFNKVTGEMEYTEIRTEPLPKPSISNEDVIIYWSMGESGTNRTYPFYIKMVD